MSIIWSNPVNRSHPLNRRLVSWYLNTPHAHGGTTFRDIQGSNHGTLTLMDPATDWVRGRPGSWGALDFDGSNDYVDLNTNFGVGAATGGAFTVSLWCKVAADTTGEMIGGYDGTKLFQMFYDAGPNEFRVSTGVPGYDTLNTSAVSLDVWYQVIYTLSDTGVGKLYLDAFLKYTDAAVTGSFDGGAEWHIGNRGGDNAIPFNGQIDDVRVYDRKLNASEVRQIYNLSRTGYGGLLNRRRLVFAVPAAGGGGGRIMGSLAGYGGLAGVGGLAGRGGGIAG